MIADNFNAKKIQQVPDRVWKGKFVIVTIGEDIIKEPIKSAEHYLRLKNLRDAKSNAGRGKW